MRPRSPLRPRSRGRFALAVAGAVVFLAYTLTAPLLPRLSLHPGLLVTLLVNLTLVGVVCAALVSLRRARGRLLLALGLSGAAAGAVFTAVGWAAPADLGKMLAAAVVGYWLAAQIGSVGVVLLVAGLTSVVDVVSVLWGPTRVMLERAPLAVDHLTVAFAWPGYRPAELVTALGISDLILFCLYVGAADRFRLRPYATAAAMCLAILVAVVAALQVSALPALPLLALAFVAVNADRLARQLRRGG